MTIDPFPRPGVFFETLIKNRSWGITTVVPHGKWQERSADQTRVRRGLSENDAGAQDRDHARVPVVRAKHPIARDSGVPKDDISRRLEAFVDEAKRASKEKKSTPEDAGISSRWKGHIQKCISWGSCAEQRPDRQILSGTDPADIRSHDGTITPIDEIWGADMTITALGTG